MGAFNNDKFVKEFACRTKINYYNLLIQKYTGDETKIDEMQEAVFKKNEVIRAMKKDKFQYEDYYEVTQLINSLVGLLVFEEQVYYKYLSDKPEKLELFKCLNQCVKHESYINTYRDKRALEIKQWETIPLEQDTPKSVLTHIRNSIAHSHLMIHPLEGMLVTENCERKITHVVFEDACLYRWDGRKWVPNMKSERFQNHRKSFLNYQVGNGEQLAFFYLKVPVECLEEMLMEICDSFLAYEEYTKY